MNNYTLIIGDASSGRGFVGDAGQGVFAQTEPLGADKRWHNSLPLTFTTDPVSPNWTLAQLLMDLEADERFQRTLFLWWYQTVDLDAAWEFGPPYVNCWGDDLTAFVFDESSGGCVVHVSRRDSVAAFHHQVVAAVLASDNYCERGDGTTAANTLLFTVTDGNDRPVVSALADGSALVGDCIAPGSTVYLFDKYVMCTQHAAEGAIENRRWRVSVEDHAGSPGPFSSRQKQRRGAPFLFIAGDDALAANVTRAIAHLQIANAVLTLSSTNESQPHSQRRIKVRVTFAGFGPTVVTLMLVQQRLHRLARERVVEEADRPALLEAAALRLYAGLTKGMWVRRIVPYLPRWRVKNVAGAGRED